MKLSTKLGLRLHLHLGRQRIYTTPLAEASNDSIAKVLTSFDTPSEVAKWLEGTEKKKNTNQGVAPDATKLPTTTRTLMLRKKLLTKWR